MATTIPRYPVSCHCRTILFTVPLPLPDIPTSRCNCSICTKRGYTFTHLPITLADLAFTAPEALAATAIGGEGVASLLLLDPEAADPPFPLKSYRFGPRRRWVHWFCATCGCSPFVSGGDGGTQVGVNFNCVDFDLPPSSTTTELEGEDQETVDWRRVLTERGKLVYHDSKNDEKSGGTRDEPWAGGAW